MQCNSLYLSIELSVLSKENKKIRLKHSEIFLRNDGIVHIQFCENCEINWRECEEITFACDQLLEKKKYPILHLSGKYVVLTREAREYSAGENGIKYSAAEAFVFTSLAHKIVANFYIKMNKPRVPTRFFTNEEEAVAWLSTFL